MAPTAEEVNRLVDAALEQDSERSMDALSQLEQISVSVELLKETTAAHRLREIEKSANPDLAKRTKRLRSQWKATLQQEVKGERNGKQGSGGRENASTSKPPKEKDREQEEKSEGGDGQRAATSRTKEDIERTGEKKRDIIREKLRDAMQKASDSVPEGDPNGLAGEIEKALVDEYGLQTKQYMSKFRSLEFNLKDEKNPDLRTSVLSGKIDPDSLVKLSTEEMASEDKRRKNEKIREHNLKEAERGLHLTASTTDQFQCGKCKQWKCTYYQMQTRSADEPMTTFVTCMNCGNRWKFS